MSEPHTPLVPMHVPQVLKKRKLHSLLHSREPGIAILRCVGARLIEQWHILRDGDPERVEIASALMVVKLCISRVRSNLVA